MLSVDADSQKISLSMKAAMAAPEKPKAKEEDEEPARVVKTKDPGSLKGGVTRPSGGEQFGLKW